MMPSIPSMGPLQINNSMENMTAASLQRLFPTNSGVVNYNPYEYMQNSQISSISN